MITKKIFAFSDLRINYTAFILFTLFLGFFKFSYHELWKDEWQAWFIANDTSLKELFSLLPKEGHPSLWFLVLRFLNLPFDLLIPNLPKEYVLQLIHYSVGVICFYILFIKSSIKTWMKIGFAYSYFVFFEYGIVNRSYVLIVLFALLVPVLLQNINKNYKVLSLLIFLLCQTEIYGVFMAVAFTFYAIYFQLHIQRNSLDRKIITSIALGLFAGILIFFITIVDTPSLSSASVKHISFVGIIQALWVNTFWIGLTPTIYNEVSLFNILLSLLILGGIIITFKSDKRILLSYFVFLILLFIFTNFVYTGGPRQWGLHFVFFIALLNLYSYSSTTLNLAIKVFIILTIGFQAAHNTKILIKEKKYLFSNAETAGRFIKKKIPRNALIIGVNKYYCTPVIAYSNRKFYSLPERETFSYFNWSEKLYIPSQYDITKFKSMLRYNDLYVVSNKPLDLTHYTRLQAIQFFDKPSIREESYFLYKYIN